MFLLFKNCITRKELGFICRNTVESNVREERWPVGKRWATVGTIGGNRPYDVDIRVIWKNPTKMENVQDLGEVNSNNAKLRTKDAISLLVRFQKRPGGRFQENIFCGIVGIPRRNRP
jgi:hypothetical protein